MRGAFAAGLTLALAVALGFLVLPVLAIFVDVSPSELVSSLGDPAATDAEMLAQMRLCLSWVLPSEPGNGVLLCKYRSVT